MDMETSASNSSSSRYLDSLVSRPMIVTYAIFSFVIIICNLTVIVIYWRFPRAKKDVPNSLIVHLSYSDLLVGVLNAPMLSIHRGHWPFGEVVCKLFCSVFWLDTFIPVVIVIILTTTRRLSVSKSAKLRSFLQRRRVVERIMLLAWSVLFVFYLGVAFGFPAVTGTHRIDYSTSCTMEYFSSEPFTLFMVAFEFILPCVVLLITCVELTVSIRTLLFRRIGAVSDFVEDQGDDAGNAMPASTHKIQEKDQCETTRAPKGWLQDRAHAVQPTNPQGDALEASTSGQGGSHACQSISALAVKPVSRRVTFQNVNPVAGVRRLRRQDCSGDTNYDESGVFTVGQPPYGNNRQLVPGQGVHATDVPTNVIAMPRRLLVGADRGIMPPDQFGPSRAADKDSFGIPPRRLKAFRRSLKSIVLIILVFLICWVPFAATSIVYAACPSCAIPAAVYDCINVLMLCNSVANPFVYAFSNRHYRGGFIKLIRSLQRMTR